MRALLGRVVAATLLTLIAEAMRRLVQARVRPRHHHAPSVTTTPYGCPLPPVIHRRVQTVKPGRLIIVGDLHGTPELFRLLDTLRYDPSTDNLVLCGDLVNKGPVSLQLLDALPALGCWAVRGNHDDAVLAAWLRHRQHGARAGEAFNPKFGWAASMTEAQAAVLAELPFTVSIPEYGVAVVHAGLIPDVPLEQQQDLWAMYKMRNVVRLQQQGEQGQEVQEGRGGGAAFQGAEASTAARAMAAAGTSGGGAAAAPTAGPVGAGPSIKYRPVEKAKEGGEAWAALWRGPPHVFFGHDARRKLQLYPHATGLDTGCVYGGSLTAAVIPPLGELRRRSPGFVAAMDAGRAVSREELCVELVAQAAEAVYAPPGDGAGVRAGNDGRGQEQGQAATRLGAGDAVVLGAGSAGGNV